MCNSLTSNQQAIRDLTRAWRDTTGNLPPLPGIFPDYPAPIVRNQSEGRELIMARWAMPSPAFALKGRNARDQCAQRPVAALAPLAGGRKPPRRAVHRLQRE